MAAKLLPAKSLAAMLRKEVRRLGIVYFVSAANEVSMRAKVVL